MPMRPSCKGVSARRAWPALALLLAASGCGSSGSSAGTAAATAGAAATAAAAAAATPGPLGGRTRVLTDPDATAMVFLYYDLAGLQPPLADWVERDSRVTLAPPIERAARRDAVRAELTAGMAAVRGVGELRLSINAALSDYDPSYGEFTVGAFAPSSVVSFTALGQKVEVKFSNARAAQTWRVAPGEAQLMRDRLSAAGNVLADAVLRLTDVQPGIAGGSLTALVVEYQLREERSGHALARLQPAPQP